MTARCLDDFAYLEELLLEADDILEGFSERYGTHRLGRQEIDPEMYSYEERIELADALRA